MLLPPGLSAVLDFLIQSNRMVLLSRCNRQWWTGSEASRLPADRSGGLPSGACLDNNVGLFPTP